MFKLYIPVALVLFGLSTQAFAQNTTSTETVQFISSSAPSTSENIAYKKVQQAINKSLLKNLKASPEIRGKEIILLIILSPTNTLSNCKLVKGINASINAQIIDLVKAINFVEVLPSQGNNQREFIIPVKFGSVISHNR